MGAALWCATALLAPTAGAQTFDGGFETDDELAFFTFTVGTDDVEVFTTSWNNEGGEAPPSGFDPVLTFFTADGTFYDSVTSASESFSRNPDRFFSGSSESGTYIVVVSVFDNLAVGSQNGGGTLDDGFEREGQPNFTRVECDQEGGNFWQVAVDCISAEGFFELVFTGAESVQPGLPAAAGCPNESNPFGGGGSSETVQTATVYAGSDWPGCASAYKPLSFGTNTIELFATGGNDPSSGLPAPCRTLDGNDPQAEPATADGQEVCGLDYAIEIVGGPGYIMDYIPDPGLTSDETRSLAVSPQEFGPGTREIRVVLLTASAPLAEPFYHRMGQVRVFLENDPAAPNNGQVQVITRAGVGSLPDDELFMPHGKGAVKADLDPVPLVRNVVGLPEPGVWLQLPAALAGLAVLARLRQRRRR